MQLALGRGSGEVRQPENPYEYPQGSACFIQSVHDDMEDIMELARSEAMLFKFGSGTGTDLSTLRSHREKLSGGGKPSGPLSFMRVYDQIAAVVKSGGKTRRAAKMQSLKDWHPDVMEFIECKCREEKKARHLHSMNSRMSGCQILSDCILAARRVLPPLLTTAAIWSYTRMNESGPEGLPPPESFSRCERSVDRSVPVPEPNLKSMASLRASSMMSSMLS